MGEESEARTVVNDARGPVRTRSARVVLHIGFHKTGTTSIQHFLWRHRDRLSERGIAFYEGRHIPHNHVELHIAAMAPERMTPVKKSRAISGGLDYRNEVEQSLQHFFSSVGANTYLFSAEGLSYLRSPEEFAWLKSVLPEPVTIVAYLRQREEYAAAYRHMISGMMAESDDPQSVAYMRPDSWLFDYETRISGFREVFGDDLVVRNYNAELQGGNIIPSFLQVLGIADAFKPDDFQLFLNKRHIRLGL